MSHVEVTGLDGLAQGELVRRREVTPVELVDAAIAQIEDANPILNAVVTPMFEEARDVSQRRALGGGRFEGVPFLVKDLVATCEGVRQTEGSAFLAAYIADRDSELIARIRRAGLVIVGKTNTPEFGNASTTEPKLFGPTRNPWNIDRTAGGSSGGSAAAVAAGLVPMAHGNDGGGSIRIPASCCGVFGLKPTRARNPLGPEYGDLCCGLYCEHALTRSVRDSAALLDETSGTSPGDPYWAPEGERPFLDEVGSSPGRLRIGFASTAPSGVPVHQDCVNALFASAKLCEDLGHEVVEASPQFDVPALDDAFLALWCDWNAWMVERWARRVGRPAEPEQFEPLTWALQELGRGRSATDHLLGLHDLQRLARDVASFFLDYDIWLTPTVAQPPPPLGTLMPPDKNPLAWIELEGNFTPFLTLANVTGQPAMSVPLFWNEDDLPIGIQFVGRFGDDATLFRLGGQLEEAKPWSTRRPRRPHAD